MVDSISHQAATALAADDGRIVIYHRPGCMFCVGMRAFLTGADNEPVWVNIWEDDEAAAYVRSVNNGNEVVPTVVIDGVAHTNPSPRMVRAALQNKP